MQATNTQTTQNLDGLIEAFSTFLKGSSRPQQLILDSNQTKAAATADENGVKLVQVQPTQPQAPPTQDQSPPQVPPTQDQAPPTQDQLATEPKGDQAKCEVQPGSAQPDVKTQELASTNAENAQPEPLEPSKAATASDPPQQICAVTSVNEVPVQQAQAQTTTPEPKQTQSTAQPEPSQAQTSDALAQASEFQVKPPAVAEQAPQQIMVPPEKQTPKQKARSEDTDDQASEGGIPKLNPVEELDAAIHDSPDSKTYVIDHPRFVRAMATFAESSSSASTHAQICSLLTTLCKGSPTNRRKVLQLNTKMIDKLKSMLKGGSKEVQKCCLLLSTLVWEERNREDLIRFEIIPLLAKCLSSSTHKIRAFAANSIGGLCVGELSRPRLAIEAGVIPLLTQMLVPNAPVSSDLELCTRASLNALWILSASRDAATQIMLHDGIQRMLEIFATVPDPTEPSNPNTIQLTRNLTACLCTVSYSPVVRHLMWTLLEQHPSGLRKLVQQMRSPEFEIAFHASAISALLMLSETNVPSLMREGAFEALNEFCKNKDPFLQDAKFHLVKSELVGFSPLFTASYDEQLMFISFICARFSSSDPRVNGKFESARSFVHDFASSLTVLAFHHNPQVARLSRLALHSIRHSPFMKLASLDQWLENVKLGEASRTQAAEILRQAELDLDILLDSTVDDELLRQCITALALPRGVCLRLWSAVSLAREHLRKTKSSLADKFDDTDDDLSDKDDTATIASTIAPAAAASGAQVFLSYSWGQKPVVKHIRDLLEAHGISCWMDEGKMKGGDELFRSIDDGITKCRVFVSCISDTYSVSENCSREIMLAADRKKLILPLIVGQLQMWPPYGNMGPLLAGKLYIDMRTPDLFSQSEPHLIVAVKTALL